MQFISPITLLIVPILGSILIVSYSFASSTTPQEDTIVLNSAGSVEQAERLYRNFIKQRSSRSAINSTKTERLQSDNADSLKEQGLHTRLKKIALITSLLNFLISIIL
jgi:hypothetical protein